MALLTALPDDTCYLGDVVYQGTQTDNSVGAGLVYNGAFNGFVVLRSLVMACCPNFRSVFGCSTWEYVLLVHNLGC